MPSQIVSHPDWSRDDTTLEAMHHCAQKSLSSLQRPEREAEPLLQVLLTSYRTRPHPAALGFLKQLVLLFGRDPDGVIAPVFGEISGLTLVCVAVARRPGGNLSELADLLEAYMALLAQICKKNARLLLHVPDQVPEMLRCGERFLIVCLGRDFFIFFIFCVRLFVVFCCVIDFTMCSMGNISKDRTISVEDYLNPWKNDAQDTACYMKIFYYKSRPQSFAKF